MKLKKMFCLSIDQNEFPHEPYAKNHSIDLHLHTERKQTIQLDFIQFESY